MPPGIVETISPVYGCRYTGQYQADIEASPKYGKRVKKEKEKRKNNKNSAGEEKKNVVKKN